MTLDRWSAVLARIVAAQPEPLEMPRDRPEGRDVFPEITTVLMPQTQMARPDAVAVGFRVMEPLPDPMDRAARLAAFAMERDVEVIILSHIDESGFERFGFRVERIAGDDPNARAVCEEQVRRFWNIDLVL